MERVLPVKFKESDLENLNVVKQYYKDTRCLDLTDSTAIKMLIADKASEIKSEKKEGIADE